MKKIDADSNGIITEEEMTAWIAYVANRTANKITDRQWKEINDAAKDAMSWDDYSHRVFGNKEGKCNLLQ